jgi:hypothetical protein
MKTTSNVQSGINIQAFAKPDILIFQSESVGGHDIARESREERNLGETNWAPKMSGVAKHANMCSKDGVDPGSFWGRSGVLWDHTGGQEVCF